jgi:hypothetical protein
MKQSGTIKQGLKFLLYCFLLFISHEGYSFSAQQTDSLGVHSTDTGVVVHKMTWPEYHAYLFLDSCKTDSLVKILENPFTLKLPEIRVAHSPDPFNPSEQEAEDEIEGSQAEGVAAPLRLGACGLPHSKDGYAAFWDAWGRRVTVAETERLIDAKMEEGASLADIIAGVARFRKYCSDTGKPPRMKPAAFVHGEKWRDDWILYPTQPTRAKKGRTKASVGPKRKQKRTAVRVKNPWVRNPAITQWSRDYRKEVKRVFNILNIDSENITDDEHKSAMSLIYLWEQKNPKPHLYRNKETGETWGQPGCKLPSAGWRTSN